MGFPWYSDSIDWNTVGESFDLYFKTIGASDQYYLILGDQEELFVFEYKNMKVGDGEGNYYDRE